MDLEREIQKLRKLKTKEEVLKSAYALLTKKYRGYRIKTITRIPELFDADVARLWARSGFLYCTHLNYLMKILLVGSNKFKEDDFVFQWTAIYYWSPHQYLKVRMDNERWVNVDVWARAYGIEFGQYASGSHSGTRTAIISK